MKLKEIGKKEMQKIYKWLFGENKWQQKKKIKKLLCITGILAAVTILSLILNTGEAGIFLVITILMWGWTFVSATAKKVVGIIAFFDSDFAILIITVVLWIFLGLIGGVISLILGVIRFIQIEQGKD